MPIQQTLAILKPDGVASGHTGQILSMIEHAGFRISGIKMLRLSRQQAEGFYEVHKGRPFFGGLVTFMTEGPVVVMVLEREDAIAHWRQVMGATNPEKADEGTIRKKFAKNIERNVVHGSDAPETAAVE
ncbi:MAG: nucleoside-diphosphate kinase, partial [Acidobacteriota bacterium]|nr:nucleoside-diphosphate kinase [Acidobacteriota bacterium]